MAVEQIIVAGERFLMNNYKRLPVAFASGKGCYLTDTEGNQYLDFLAGVAVNNLGHCPDEVVEAVQKQAAKLMHASNFFWIDSQIELARLLVENSFADKAFFCNSGAEANEAAIKLARKYSYKKHGAGKDEIIAMKGSFHGRTLAALAATDNKKYREGYGPMPGSFKFVSFNDIDDLRDNISQSTCAVMLEPIQGEGGVTAAKIDYLKAVKELADANDILLIFDEIQCGLARTGRLFAYESYGVTPHIISLAKALGNGFPIGALLTTDDIAAAWQPGDHGTTFGGNPLACAAGVAALTKIIDEKLWEKAESMGNYFKEKLEGLATKYKSIKQVKGMGLMLGLELETEGAAVVEKAFAKKLVINCTAGKVLRFLPPLIISESEIDVLIGALSEIFDEIQLT